MRRALPFVLPLLAACPGGTTETVAPPGLVVRIHLDDALDPAAVGGFDLVVAREGGFPELEPSVVDGLTRSAEDRDGDGANEVVLTWPKGYEFAADFNVRLTFDTQESLAVDLAGTAFDASRARIAEGTASASVPPGQAREVDLPVTCLVEGCGAKPALDMGPDTRPDGPAPDAGPDAVIGDDAGPVQTGETVTSAGRSEGGTLTLWHHFGHPFVRTTSTGGTLQLKSIIATER